jgi:hypothetical protein
MNAHHWFEDSMSQWHAYPGLSRERRQWVGRGELESGKKLSHEEHEEHESFSCVSRILRFRLSLWLYADQT